MTADVVRAAERHLRVSHPRFRVLVEVQGPCSLHRGRPQHFDVLANSIISQQLSTKAAATIKRRVFAAVGDTRLTPAALRQISAKRLRDAGLSAAKTNFLKNLAAAASDGDLNFRALARLDNEAVVERLTTLPGIGPWTAQMYLMFGLRRADIASPADLGLRKAVAKLYELGHRPDEEEFLRIADDWRPYRTVASWYLWRMVD